MQTLQVKMIAERDENNDIVKFFVQTIAYFPKSTVEPAGMGSIQTTSSGAKIELHYNQKEGKAWVVNTPVLHQFEIAGTQLTDSMPVLEIDIVDPTESTAAKKKRIVHRDDADEDQMPGG